jgi:hypothetical protein
VVKKILLGLLAVIVVFLIVVALQSSEYKVSRSATMNAQPGAPFDQVNDFKNWKNWSPFLKLDPNMEIKIDGADSGVGAKYAWKGNDNAGEGNMEITESKPNELIRIKLEFTKPHANVCPTEFTFVPEGDNTKVTWTMSGQKNFLMKAVCLFMNMDKEIGPHFEEGLANMKKVVEPPL